MGILLDFKSVPEMIHARAAEYEDKTYLIFLEKEVSYRQLDDWSIRLANYLHDDLKIGEKQNIGILLPNGVEFLVSFFGAMYARCTAMPYNTLLKAEELLYQMDHSEIPVLITTAAFHKAIKPILPDLKKLKTIIFVDAPDEAENPISFWDSINGAKADLPASFANIKPTDIASMIYTSGTTGHPKGCMLSHGNYIADLNYVLPNIEIDDDDTSMCIMPLFHVNGQVGSVLSTIGAGGTLVLEEMFKPRTFIPTLKKYKCRTFSAVPAMYNFLNEMPEYKDGEDLSFLKACICGAAPMPIEVFNKFERKFNAKIIEGYGLSEGTCVSSLNPLHGERKIGSIGLALEGQQMAIADSEGKHLPDGEVGEIVVSGDNVMQGYFKNEEATRDTIRNGWLHTGDMGYRDNDGYYFITGRKKEMIIRGGENIYPKEIEEALYEHDAIMDCAVIGMPDKKYGEQVVAVIKLKEGAITDAKEMRKFLKAKIANYKMPARYEFVLDLPKTSTGKIQKLKLRDEMIGDQKTIKKMPEVVSIHYRWHYGEALTRFFTEIRENGQLLGLRCSKCKKVYCPPMRYCGVCFADCDEWVELKQTAKVTSFTTVHMVFPGQPKEPPYIMAYIRFDGSDTDFYHIIGVEDESEVYIGLPVKAVWKDKKDRKGDASDIVHFIPIEGQTKGKANAS